MTASVGDGVMLGTERTTKGESMTDYKPEAGDLVQVVNRGDWWVGLRGIVTGLVEEHVGGIAFYEIRFPEFVTPEGGRAEKARFMASQLQRLVVLDLDALGTTAPAEGETVAQYVVRTLRGPAHGLATRQAVADQIEAQTKPPRIPEPGLWGVVEATVAGIPRRRWVHHEEDRWVSDNGIPLKAWDELIDPVLVREGVDG